MHSQTGDDSRQQHPRFYILSKSSNAMTTGCFSRPTSVVKIRSSIVLGTEFGRFYRLLGFCKVLKGPLRWQ